MTSRRIRSQSSNTAISREPENQPLGRQEQSHENQELVLQIQSPKIKRRATTPSSTDEDELSSDIAFYDKQRKP